MTAEDEAKQLDSVTDRVQEKELEQEINASFSPSCGVMFHPNVFPMC